MKKETMYTVVVTPKLETECNFLEEYNLLKQAQYRINTPPYERIYIQNKSKEKICALCDKAEPEVSFTKESHLLPASLGNNKYFSHEECNDCNEKYGEQLESELAQMFGLQRTIAGVKGRTQPKIKFHTGETIEFDRQINSAKITAKEEGKIVIDKKENEVSIAVEMPKYKPYYSLISILKSTWLLLGSDQRKDYPLIKTLVTEEKNDNISFFHMYLPGNGSAFTTLNIYTLKNTEKELSPLIVQFNFLNRVIFWHYPINSQTRKEVFPSVHFSFHEKTTNVKMNGYTINSKTEWGGKENLTLKFDRVEEFTGKDYSPPKRNLEINNQLPNHDVLMQMGELKLITNLTVIRYDNEINEFAFEGKELGGCLRYLHNKLFNKQEITFVMNLSSVPLTEALKTINFLEKGSTKPDRLEVTVNGNLLLEGYDLKINMEVDFDAIKKGIGYLETINNEFGLNLRYPARLSQSEFKDVKHLASAINYGSFSEESDYLDQVEISCDPHFMQLLEENKEKELSLDLNGKKEFKFLGKKFGPYDFTYTLVMPQVISKEEQELSVSLFKLKAKSFIHTYPLWSNKEDPS